MEHEDIPAAVAMDAISVKTEHVAPVAAEHQMHTEEHIQPLQTISIKTEPEDIPTLISTEIQIDNQKQPTNITSQAEAATETMDSDQKNDMHDNDDDDDDDDEDETFDDNLADESTTCLFCDNVSNSVDTSMEHMTAAHDIDFKQLKIKFQMDQYSFIKLINCIRQNKISAEHLKTAQSVFWHDEKYLKPGDYESWLTYDYEQMGEETNEEEPEQLEQFHERYLEQLDTQQENLSVDSEEITQLRSLVKDLYKKVLKQSFVLQHATDDMDKMRKGYRSMVENDKSTTGEKNEEKPHLQHDEGYFSSYAHFGIHHEMLSDVVRTTSYRNALLNNKDFISNKDVLDVGCGTAILSIFASQATAKTVIGIDNSEIVYNAMDIIKTNKIENVTLIKGCLETTDLPLQEFDIIISEWMGYFLLFECMLDTIIYARHQYLKPGGMLLPNRCTMSLIGFGDEKLFNDHIDFWKNVYDVDMSVMRKMVLKEPLIQVVDAAHILTEAEIIADFDLMTVDLNYTNFNYAFNLKCTKAGTLSAFVGYFSTFFDLPSPISFGTSPNEPPTHWKQVVFFIGEPKQVNCGDVISGQLVCSRSRSNTRSLDITIEVFSKKHSYYLD